jgi:hypothetical protein
MSNGKSLDPVDEAYAAIEKLDFIINVMVYGADGMTEALAGEGATEGLARILGDIRDTVKQYLDYERDQRLASQTAPNGA